VPFSFSINKKKKRELLFQIHEAIKLYSDVKMDNFILLEDYGI